MSSRRKIQARRKGQRQLTEKRDRTIFRWAWQKEVADRWQQLPDPTLSPTMNAHRLNTLTTETLMCELSSGYVRRGVREIHLGGSMFRYSLLWWFPEQSIHKNPHVPSNGAVVVFKSGACTYYAPPVVKEAM